MSLMNLEEKITYYIKRFESLKIILLLTVLLIAIFETWLAIQLNPEIMSYLVKSSWITFVIGFLVYFNRSVFLLGSISLIITLTIYYFDVSTYLFLGNEIASDYVAETPGFTEVKLYKLGYGSVSYGGVFGISETFYLKYTIDDDTVRLLSDDKSVSIMNYSIEINEKEYSMKIE